METKEDLLKRIRTLRELQTRIPRQSELLVLDLTYKNLVLDILEYLLIADTARNIERR